MKHIHAQHHGGVASDPQPADLVQFRNRSERIARIRVKGRPPGPTPPPPDIEVPKPPLPPLPTDGDAETPIMPPANLVKYSAEAQYDNDPTWVECAPDLELPESRKTITVQLNTNNEVEWQAE